MDNASAPLADYFWIAGVESITYDDGLATAQLDDIIAEDGEGEEADTSIVSSSRVTARHSRQNSANRLSTLSKLSIVPSISSDARSVDDFEGTTKSNRSSATIRPNPPPGANGGTNGINGNNAGLLGFGIGPDGLPDFDFDKALLKFAAERENFLDDLSFSAGAKTQARPPMINPRTERLKVAEEGDQSGRMSPLMKSLRGSIRRKMSFRDMTSVRKQPMAPKPGLLNGLRLS